MVVSEKHITVVYCEVRLLDNESEKATRTSVRFELVITPALKTTFHLLFAEHVVSFHLQIFDLMVVFMCT